MNDDNNVKYEVEGLDGDDNAFLSPLIKDVCVQRTKKLHQWIKDTVDLGDMANLKPKEIAATIISLLVNETVRAAQKLGVPQEVFLKNIKTTWDALDNPDEWRQQRQKKSASSADESDEPDDDEAGMPVPIGGGPPPILNC